MSERVEPRHLIRLNDLPSTAVDELLDLAARMKSGEADRPSLLAGRNVGLLFFRPSLRTRASFSAAAHQLGAHTLELTAASDFWQLEEREGTVMDGAAPEHIRDAAAVMSAYCSMLAIRPAFGGQSWAVDRRDAQIRSWARWARVPVVNLESALWHPLQALADLATLRETFGSLAGRRLAITWVHSPVSASHAVANSLLCAALRAGMHVHLAHPPGFDLDEGVLREARELAAQSQAELEIGGDRLRAAEGADVVYARSWFSLEHYGNPTLAASLRSRHVEWTVDESLMARGREARLMHAMPVRRNVEVSDAVLDGPRSLVQAQAAARLHIQKAVLATWLGSAS